MFRMVEVVASYLLKERPQTLVIVMLQTVALHSQWKPFYEVDLKAYSLMSKRGRSQNFQTLPFLHIFV